MGFVTGFLQFCYDFVVGDAWEIAAGVVVVLVLGALAVALGKPPYDVIPPLIGAGVILVVAVSIYFEARRRAGA